MSVDFAKGDGEDEGEKHQNPFERDDEKEVGVEFVEGHGEHEGEKYQNPTI